VTAHGNTPQVDGICQAGLGGSSAGSGGDGSSPGGGGSNPGGGGSSPGGGGGAGGGGGGGGGTPAAAAAPAQAPNTPPSLALEGPLGASVSVRLGTQYARCAPNQAPSREAPCEPGVRAADEQDAPAAIQVGWAGGWLGGFRPWDGRKLMLHQQP
jgi:hypothetical protein